MSARALLGTRALMFASINYLLVHGLSIVTLFRVVGLQSVFENQFDTAIHPATVTGIVGVLEGLAHAACQQQGSSAMPQFALLFGECFANAME